MILRLDPRELDRRFVPVAARRLRRLLEVTARRRRTTAGPQLAVLAVLVVAAAVVGGAAAVLLSGDDAVPSTAAAPAAAPVTVRLGAPAGGEVEPYLQQSRVLLDETAESSPESRRLAVVHLSRYLGPDELLALLSDAAPLRLYLRASTAGPDAEVVPVPVEASTAAEILPALCAATSERRAQDARSLAELAARTEPATPAQVSLKADLEAGSARAAAEAQAYAGSCSTGFAAVVEAAVTDLRDLLGRDGVRGVELAPTGALLSDVEVSPLLPETVGVAP